MNKSNDKKNILIITNLPTPYRLPLLNELSTLYNLKVIFYKSADKNRKWSNNLYLYNFNWYTTFSLNLFHFNISFISMKKIMWADRIIVIENNWDSITLNIQILFYYLFYKKKYILWVGHNEVGFDYLTENNSLMILTRRILHLYKRIVYKYASSFIAYSSMTKNYLEHRGVSFRDIFVGGQVMPEVLLGKPDIIIKDEYIEINILTVAYLTKRKGIDILIKAFLLLPQSEYKLFIVGDGRDKKYFESLAIKNRNIIFTGYLNGSNLENIYKNCDIFVFPTYKDPWGHVVTEAMYYGLPIICSENAGVKDTLTKYDMLFNPGDEHELANKILLLSSTLPNNQKMIKARQKASCTEVKDALITFEKAINYTFDVEKNN